MDLAAFKIDRNTLTNATNSLPGIADTLANLGLDKAKELMAQVNLLLRLLQSAGYGVCGLATELALSPKITMTLKTSPAVKEEKLAAILRDHPDKKIVIMVVASLIQANKLRDSVTVETIALEEVEIVLTSSPNITLRWKDVATA